MGLGDSPFSNRDLILHGGAQLAEGLGKVATQNRPLSPTEQDMAEIASGADPREVAMRRKLRHAGHLPMDVGTDQNGYSNNRIGSGLSAPVEGAPSQFQTKQDYDAAMQVAPFVTRKQVAQTQAETTMQRTAKTEEGKNNRQDKGIASKEGMADEALTEKRREFDRNLKFKYDSLKSQEDQLEKRLGDAMDISNNRIGADQRIALLRTVAGDARTYETSLTTLLASFNELAGDPNTKAEIEQKLKILQEKRKSVEELSQYLQQQYGPKGTAPARPQSSTTIRKSGAGSKNNGKIEAPQGTKAEDLSKMFGVQK
jgi:hypothetical protein